MPESASITDSFVACDSSPAASSVEGGHEWRNWSPLAKGLFIALCVIVVIILLAWWWSSRQQPLVNQLASQGWMLYTKPGCSYCTAQYAELGIYDGAYPNQVVCDSPPSPLGPGGTPVFPIDPKQLKKAIGQTLGPIACEDVPGFPYWINAKNGDYRVGLQRQADLQAMLKSSGPPPVGPLTPVPPPSPK